MFVLNRKREPQVINSSQSQRIDGRYVRVDPSGRGGYVEYGQSYYPLAVQNTTGLGAGPHPIPERDIPEAYLSQQEQYEVLQRRGDPSRSSKGSRRILPFLQKKKKGQTEADFDNMTDDIGLSYGEEGDADDITSYEEAVAVSLYRQDLKQNNLNPMVLEQLASMQLEDSKYGAEAQLYERLNYIVNNYQRPPPYPGPTSIDSGPSMIKQLLQEKEGLHIKDNASMINFCQVDAPNGLSMEDLTKIMRAFPEDNADYRHLPQRPQQQPNSYVDIDMQNNNHSVNQLSDTAADRLVMRTQGPVQMDPNSDTHISAHELFERRNQYYRETYRESTGVKYRGRHIAEVVSELYPRDYDADYEQNPVKFDQTPVTYDPVKYNQDTCPDSSFIGSLDRYSLTYDDHPERDYDDAPRRYSVPTTQPPPYTSIDRSLDGDHYRRRSETFVPPSPYLNTEIPEWLQVYARASPELDKFIEWDMFRYSDLDCWQTMLKRLYKKELEQIVLWFEEYRQSLQKEMERRERELGIRRPVRNIVDTRVKKTDV